MIFAPKEKGSRLIEYALILIFVSLTAIILLAILGPIMGIY